MNTITPETILKEFGHRIEQYRIRLDLTQADLAKEAGIGKRTLERLEDGQTVQVTTLIAVLRQFDLLDEFTNLIPDPAKSPMAMVLADKKVRYRASKSRNKKPPEPWTWND